MSEKARAAYITNIDFLLAWMKTAIALETNRHKYRGRPKLKESNLNAFYFRLAFDVLLTLMTFSSISMTANSRG